MSGGGASSTPVVRWPPCVSGPPWWLYEGCGARYGVWGGTVPAQRREVAHALGANGATEFARRLAAALDAWERSTEQGAA